MAFFSFPQRGILSVDLLYNHDGKVFKRMIRQVEIPSHWFLQAMVVNIRSVACKTYASRSIDNSQYTNVFRDPIYWGCVVVGLLHKRYN